MEYILLIENILKYSKFNYSKWKIKISIRNRGCQQCQQQNEISWNIPKFTNSNSLKFILENFKSWQMKCSKKKINESKNKIYITEYENSCLFIMTPTLYIQLTLEIKVI